MAPQGKYIYGIIEEARHKSFNFSGVGGAKVYTVNNQELAAVVSDTELQEIDPTRKNVHAHTVVQDELLKEYALLPMGFGMVAGSDEAVQKLLERNHRELVSELRRLADKVEAALKVFWDQEAVIKELEGKNQELTRFKSRINAAMSPLEAQHLLIEAGNLVERIVIDWKTRYAESVYGTLKVLSLDARLNNLLGIRNILNASFLINRASESEFKAEVYRLDAQYQGRLNFKYVGPLPPYNFINVRLEPVA